MGRHFDNPNRLCNISAIYSPGGVGKWSLHGEFFFFFFTRFKQFLCCFFVQEKPAFRRKYLPLALWLKISITLTSKLFDGFDHDDSHTGDLKLKLKIGSPMSGWGTFAWSRNFETKMASSSENFSDQEKALEYVKSLIRPFPDFPQPGILFRWDHSSSSFAISWLSHLVGIDTVTSTWKRKIPFLFRTFEMAEFCELSGIGGV